jgi:hypothetical protein
VGSAADQGTARRGRFEGRGEHPVPFGSWALLAGEVGLESEAAVHQFDADGCGIHEECIGFEGGGELEEPIAHARNRAYGYRPSLFVRSSEGQ